MRISDWSSDVCSSDLSSMMAPTPATSAEGARFAIGSGGSNRIRTAVLQVLVNLLDVGLPMAAATEAARLHIEGEAVANIEAAEIGRASCRERVCQYV